MMGVLHLAVIAGCLGGLAASAAPASDDELLFGKVRINLFSGVSAPPYPMGEGFSTNITASPYRNKWAVFAVEYHPRLENNKNAFIDDVILTLTVTFLAQTQGQELTGVMTGSTHFWTVPLDNRRHVATMMIPPQMLDRYLKASGSGSTVNASTFVVRAVFSDRAGNLLGRGYYGMRGSQQAMEREFAQLIGGKSVELPNAVLSRDNTPWAPLRADNYDLIKPASIQAPK